MSPWKQIPAERHRDPLKNAGLAADFLSVAADLPSFDPRVIERFAENAYRKANAIFMGCVIGGVVLGAIFGATPLTPLGAGWPIPQEFGFATMLVGAFVGGVIGYVVGDTRSALCRLQGQTALAQVESAKNASAMAKAMKEIHEIHEQIRTLGVPAAAPAPEPQRQEPEPPPVLPVLPALRVAGGNEIKPPPLTPPSP